MNLFTRKADYKIESGVFTLNVDRKEIPGLLKFLDDRIESIGNDMDMEDGHIQHIVLLECVGLRFKAALNNTHDPFEDHKPVSNFTGVIGLGRNCIPEFLPKHIEWTEE